MLQFLASPTLIEIVNIWASNNISNLSGIGECACESVCVTVCMTGGWEDSGLLAIIQSSWKRLLIVLCIFDVIVIYIFLYVLNSYLPNYFIHFLCLYCRQMFQIKSDSDSICAICNLFFRPLKGLLNGFLWQDILLIMLLKKKTDGITFLTLL